MKIKSKISAFLSAVILAAVLLVSGQALGQNSSVKAEAVKGNQQELRKGQFAMIPGLTEEQKTKIQDLRYERNKDQQMLQAQLSEKKAHLRTLTLADSPDRKAIDKNIDEISALKGTMMKHAVNMKFNVKSILTPEQYKAWEMHGQQMKNKKSQGNRNQNMKGDGNRMQSQRGAQNKGNYHRRALTPALNQNN